MQTLSLILAWAVLIAATLAAITWGIDRAMRLAGLSGLIFMLTREACRKEHPAWWVTACRGIHRKGD